MTLFPLSLNGFYSLRILRSLMFFICLILSSTNLMSQSYEQEWKEINGFIEKQLPKSAYEKASKLFDKAMISNNQEQIVKTAVYLMNLEPQLKEVEYDSRLQKEILHLESSISKTEGSIKYLLISILADKYNQYAQQNQWRLSQNTTTIDAKSNDIALWSLDRLQDKAQQLYLQSCESKETQKVSLTTFKSIINYANSKYITTLYDFLHHRAIQALSNERNYISEPSYVFTIKKEQLLDLEKFAAMPIVSKDTNSNKYLTLKLYQKMLKEHMVDNEKDMLIDLELRRLEFVFNNYNGEQKNKMYERLLLNFFEKFNSNSEAYYALIQLAQLKQNEAQNYEQTRDSAKQWLLKDAYDIYQRIIRECKNPNIVHLAKNQAIGILENIQYQVTLEKVYSAQKPILTYINYRNITKLYYRIIEKKSCSDRENEYYQDQASYFKKILAGKVFYSGSLVLKNVGDYQNHTTEFALPSLDNGSYFVVFSHNPDFSVSNNILSENAILVSDLAYFIRKEEHKGDLSIYVVNRNSGAPIKDAQVEFYRQEWRNNRNVHELFKTDKTNENGMVSVQADKTNQLNFSYKISKNGDILCENQYEYLYYNGYNLQENIQENYQLFLDREIYRPNQTIYFKGIAYASSNKSTPRIIANKKVDVVFKDVNWQDIAKQTLMTNEYGTFSGTLTAPSGTLLGNMNIQINGVYNKSLRVEEYKRPTFEILFDTLKSSPKLDEMVKISGKAMTYSGAPLNGVVAKYHVVRKTNYPYWRCWWIPIPSNEAEIANGEIKTDERGQFEFSYKAIPDESADNTQFPLYNYEIKVDVVDITGETHNAEKTVKIGKVDFEIFAPVSPQYSKTDSLKIPISILNLNGDKMDKSVQVKINKLVDPSIIYQNRYWEVPDMPIMALEEFRAKFPFMPYKREDKMENYKLDNFKKEYNLHTIQNPFLSENIQTWASGSYKMTISAKNSDGKDISVDRYFKILGKSDIIPSESLVVSGMKSGYEPNEKATLKLTSAQKGQKFLYTLVRNNIETSPMWNSQQIVPLSIEVMESDRGGMYIEWASVWNNRFYEGKEMLNIPWTNKELDIEYATFRDKLQPGQNEEWQIKIKGKKGEKLMAELLANMYDQSLDEFAINHYSFFPFSNISIKSNFYSHSFSSMGIMMNLFTLNRSKLFDIKGKEYPELNIIEPTYGIGLRRGGMYKNMLAKGEVMAEMAMAPSPAMADDAGMSHRSVETKKSLETKGNGMVSNSILGVDNTKSNKKTEPIKIRTNLNETVFFFPHLMTDENGNVLIKFKMNEALTKWKFMTLATTKDLQIGYAEKSVVTQKDLMITPNAPRFMRENDLMDFTAKITNLSDKTQNGTAQIELYDAVTNKSVLVGFGLEKISSQPFSISSGQSSAISWKIKVPEGMSALTYRVIAKSDKFSDGEENSLPILTDRMLVTETMPLPIRAQQTKLFTFKEMQEKIHSSSLKNVLYRLEYTSNPMWYAIQALPYLMEYPYECSEQLFNRYYANALSSSIIAQFPKIKSVFESWKGTEAMQSNLSKNQTLKSALLEETPWVLQAQSEEEQRRNIALLFDINKIASEEQSIIEKLYDRQMPNGAFPWFPGAEESPYITQNIVEGFGHLKVLGVKNYSEKSQQILQRAIPYLDGNIVKHYREMEESVKRYGGKLSDDHLDAFAIHYLYTRSYFPNDYPKETQKVIQYYHDQAVKYWTKKLLYEEGMLALYLNRTNDKKITNEMMKSFRERALKNEEKGMYWDNLSGYWWYQLPIETHSLMIEVFDQLSNDQREKDDLRVYLLKNKQTNSWKTTKATAAAIYALLGNQSTTKLEIAQTPKIKIGNEDLAINLSEAEAGTGYFKKTWLKDEIKPDLAQIEISNPNPNIAWGAVYWQYNEKLNSIQVNKSSPLRIEKIVYKVLNTDKGEQLVEIKEGNLSLGDRVRIKLMLYVEREMEFLHLKDMRASGLEPRDQVSGYKWSGGLGYYQTSRDASMNFFIDHISKGTYIIEYDLNTNIRGTFSNGITTFQSMYAPEFNSHSEGKELIIK